MLLRGWSRTPASTVMDCHSYFMKISTDWMRPSEYSGRSLRWVTDRPLTPFVFGVKQHRSSLSLSLSDCVSLRRCRSPTSAICRDPSTVFVWYLTGGEGGHVLVTEFRGMALNGLFCADVLLPRRSRPHHWLYLQIPPAQLTVLRVRRSTFGSRTIRFRRVCNPLPQCLRKTVGTQPVSTTPEKLLICSAVAFIRI